MLFAKIFITCFVYAGERGVDLRDFKRMWRYWLPQITRKEPLADPCLQCHTRKQLIHSNLPYSLRFCKILEQQQHLDLVKKEHQLYQEMSAKCGMVCEDSHLSFGPSRPASRNITMSYSFDYTQQVNFDLIN